MNSRGFALWSFICLVLLLKVLVWLYWPLELNPGEFTGFAFWRCSGALYFERLRGLILVNLRGFAF